MDPSLSLTQPRPGKTSSGPISPLVSSAPKSLSQSSPSSQHQPHQRQLSQTNIGQFALEELPPARRRQSILVLNGDVSLKLPKGSSARPKLYTKEHREELLSRLADIIKNSNEQDLRSTKGRLPIEAAYMVVKRVTEAVKAPILPVGMSTFNRLESMRTDPALKLLRTTTWRDFFEADASATTANNNSNNKATNRASSGPSALTGGAGEAVDGSQSLTEQQQNQQQQQQQQGVETDPLLSLLFDSLIDRVESLWQTLKIPHREQQFFGWSLCRRPIESLDQCKELAGYIERLEEHKVRTKAVLQQIALREAVVAKLYDLVSALHRKFSKSNSSSGYPASSSSSSNSVDVQHWGVFWKEEFILALDEVRCASLETIKAVQLWRRAMWRPHSFFYREVNYLLKMKDDLALLESDMMTKIIAAIPLQRDDLQCIVYVPLADFPAAPPATASGPFESVTRGPGSYSRRSASLESLHEHDPPPSTSSPHIEQLLSDFAANIDREELRAAAAVVLEEETLQAAIASEQVALKSKGVFIPLLRAAATASAAAPHTATATASTPTATRRPVSASSSSGSRSGRPPLVVA
jgi:hypothetical protein